MSKEEEARLAREKKKKFDEIKKKYSGRASSRNLSRDGSRANSQVSKNSSAKSRERDVTKCTRDDELNIEEFMREDMRQINKDEDKLQREIMAIHQKSLGKNARVYTKHRIDTSLKSTEDFLRKAMMLPR